MRLNPEKLPSHFDNKGIAPVYLIHGDEPLQKMEISDQIKNHASEQGYKEKIILEVTKGFEWQTLLEEAASISLFSSKRLIDLRLGDHKPGRDGGAVLVEYCGNIPADTVLLITSCYLNKQAQQTKWYKGLDKAGIVLQSQSVDAAALPDWIIRRGRKYNKRISQTAARLLADRVEGNLLAASQEIEKLGLIVDKENIENEDILAAVTDNSRFDTFTMITSALSGDSKRTIHMLQGLENEGIDPAAVYGALIWDYRRLCSMAYHYNNGTALEKLFIEERIWDQSKKQAIRSTLGRHKLEILHQLLRKLGTIDKVLKSPNRVFVWEAMQEFLLSVSGFPLITSNTDLSG